MKSLHYSGLWCLAIGVFLLECSNEGALTNFPYSIRDYVYRNAVHEVFHGADKLKYAQDYVGAANAFEKIVKRELPKDDRIYALNQLAFVRLKMRQTVLAKRCLEQLQVYYESFSDIQLADYLYNVGVLNLQEQNPQEARLNLEHALEIYKDEYNEDHLRIALTWAQLALHQVDFGLKAKEVNQTIETAFQFFYPENRQDSLLYPFAEEINYAMAQYYRMGSRNYQAGLNHCELADQLIHNKPNKWVDTVLWARSLCVRALLLRKDKHFQAADSILHRGLELLVAQGKNSVFIQEMYRFLLVNAASWETKTINRDSLYKAYRKQLDDYLMKTGQPETYVQRLELDAYYCYYRLTDEKKSKDCHNAALQLRKVLHPEVPFFRYYIEEANNILATIYLNQENYDSASYYQLESFKTEIVPDISSKISSWSQAIQPQFADQRSNPFFAFEKAGSIYFKKFQKNNQQRESLEKSLELYEAADKTMSLSLSMSEDGVLSYQQEMGDSLYHGGLRTLLKAWKLGSQKFDKKQILGLAFRFFERQKSFVLIRDKKVSKMSTKEKTELTKSTMNKINLLKKTAITISQRQELARANFAYPQLLKELENKFKDQNISSFEDIQRRLNANQVLVQYKVCQDFTYVLAITKEACVFDTIGHTNMIETYVARFLKLLSNPHRQFKPELIDSSKMMYNKFIKPFETIIPKQPAELVIIPDRFLTDIPFDAFPLPINQKPERWRKVKYLLHKYYVVYAPSWKIWQDYRYLKPLTKGHRAAFFSYTLGSTLSSEYELYDAKKEHQAIANFMLTKKFTNADCSAHNLIDCAFRYKLLHLCLHGKSNRDTLNANQIFFKIENNRKVSPLSGVQIATLDLTGKWAVISACETGIGKTNAEGTYSLARAFIQAGCEFTISSLWEIRDKASSEILEAFYNNVKNGDLPWIALNKAKRHFIEHNSESTPYIWAALIPTI